MTRSEAMTLEIGPDSALINATRNVQLETSAHYSEAAIVRCLTHRGFLGFSVGNLWIG